MVLRQDLSLTQATLELFIIAQGGLVLRWLLSGRVTYTTLSLFLRNTYVLTVAHSMHLEVKEQLCRIGFLLLSCES